MEYLKRYRAPRDIRTYFRTHQVKKLNVGCGYNILSDWLNVDAEPKPGAIYLDGGKPWPYPSNSFAAVLAEHVIEHVPKPDGIKFLSEAFRVLEPGGYLRIVTPDLTFLMRLACDDLVDAKAYLTALRTYHRLSVLTNCDAVNLAFYSYGHRYLYTTSELRASLESAGFIDIVENRAGQPQHAIFVGAEGHGDVLGDELNAKEAFALEARKP